MNHKAYAGFLVLISLTLAFLTSCSSSSHTTPPPVVAIAATSGTPQNAVVGAAFAAPLVATVTTGGTPTAGVSVTFTAPAATDGTFANTTTTDTETTSATGIATSTVFTAGTTAGAYNVTASVAGASSPANFALTNTAGAPTTLAATSGTPQNVAVNATAAPLVAQVTDSDGNGVSGVAVTFTAPSSGASGTFTSTGTNTETDNTDASGNATAADFVANSTTGGPYNVVATSGAFTPVNFVLTNTVAVATPNTYVFYLSGSDTLPALSGNYNFYALAGAVTIDASGNVIGGEQDYNNGITVTGAGDAIQPANGALVVNPATGEGTLTLTTLDANVGVNGVETLNIQFVNSNHALIMQFDGSATSSGSLDLQTLPGTMDGNYAYAFSGVDKTYAPTALGGVFTITGTAVAGVTDQNDNGVVNLNQPFAGTLSAPDLLGRGSLSITGSTSIITYYIVRSEVIRVIDVDTNKSNIGSAFGQGGGSFSNASLPNSILAVAGNSFTGGLGGVAALGQFSTNTGAATFSGVADDSEIAFGFTPVEAAAISGTYSIPSNGYGSMTISLGDFTALGIYMTDPTLNLSDPNNPTGGGGALVVDISASGILSGTTGVLVPQTDTTPANFSGTYAVGWQNINSFAAPACTLCEFDFIGLTSVGASNALNGTGQASDPFLTLTSATTDSGVAFSGTPAVDGANPGRYSMTQGTASVFNWFGGALDLDIYQASGGQLFWLNWDSNSVFLGPLEQQGSLSGIPAARKPAAKTHAKQKP
jgi:hypothetical protein